MTDREDLDILSSEEIPDDAAPLQCGVIVGDDGAIGRIDPAETDPDT